MSSGAAGCGYLSELKEEEEQDINKQKCALITNLSCIMYAFLNLDSLLL